MKNLFEFATKELSQDAFLLWVLSNATDCGNSKEDVAAKNLSIDFISFLTGKRGLKIKNVVVHPQWERIDIVAEITTTEGDRFNIFIEDKTTSDEHHQLAGYTKKINEKYSGADNIKIFYKTDMIELEERKRVDAAGWYIVEFEDIANFWKCYIKSDNCIISMYAERVMDIYNALRTNTLPSKNNDREIEMLTWKGYFCNRIIPKINKKCSAFLVKTNYKYIALIVKPINIDKNEAYPYIEIRDRDCANGNFKALVLTYGMAEKKQKCKEFDKILDANNKKSGTLFKKSNSNSTKQVLTTNVIEVKNDTEFESYLNSCIDMYLEIMNVVFG